MENKLNTMLLITATFIYSACESPHSSGSANNSSRYSSSIGGESIYVGPSTVTFELLDRKTGILVKKGPYRYRMDPAGELTIEASSNDYFYLMTISTSRWSRKGGVYIRERGDTVEIFDQANE